MPLATAGGGGAAGLVGARRPPPSGEPASAVGAPAPQSLVAPPAGSCSMTPGHASSIANETRPSSAPALALRLGLRAAHPGTSVGPAMGRTGGHEELGRLPQEPPPAIAAQARDRVYGEIVCARWCCRDSRPIVQGARRRASILPSEASWRAQSVPELCSAEHRPARWAGSKKESRGWRRRYSAWPRGSSDVLTHENDREGV